MKRLQHATRHHDDQRPIWVAAIIAGCFLAMGTVVSSQESSSIQSIQLVLEAEQTTFVVGEPVYVTVRLRNVGSTAAEVFQVLDPRAGAIRVVIETQDRPQRVFLPLSLVDVNGGVTRLTPGRELAAIIPIFFGGLKWTFSQPGTYTITATYRHGKTVSGRTLRSNSVGLSVSPGDGASRLLIDDSRTSEEAGKFLVWQQGDHLRQGLDRLKKLVTTFPDSPLADYVRQALGHNLSRTFRDYSIGKTRRQDCASALSYLQQVRIDRLPAYLRIQKLLDEARCHYTSGRSSQASEALAQARLLGHDHAEYQPLFAQTMRLEPRLQTTQ